MVRVVIIIKLRDFSPQISLPSKSRLGSVYFTKSNRKQAEIRSSPWPPLVWSWRFLPERGLGPLLQKGPNIIIIQLLMGLLSGVGLLPPAPDFALERCCRYHPRKHSRRCAVFRISLYLIKKNYMRANTHTHTKLTLGFVYWLFDLITVWRRPN